MLTYQELARLPADELAKQDIAAMNLACAAGLPKTEWLKPQACLDQLDFFAREVKRITAIEFKHFRERPGDFNNSESFFRALSLITVLQRDLRIHYDPFKTAVDAPFEPRDSFLFGITGWGVGTCGSLPVLYAAVGRRLGYPMKLVDAFGGKACHLFCRWVGDETFNIDGAGHGMDSPPDSFYRTGRYALDPKRETEGQFLKSKTPADELACFLVQRAWRWKEAGNFGAAAEAVGLAVGLAPANKRYSNTWNGLLGRWTVKNRARLPTIFPKLRLHLHRRRFTNTVPLDDEFEFMGLQATQLLLDDPVHDRQHWEPQRQRAPRIEVPTEASVEYDGRYYTIHFTKNERFIGSFR